MLGATLRQNGDYYRFTLQQEYQALQRARGKATQFPNPDETGYTLELALDRLCFAADTVIKEKRLKGEQQWFGETYSRLGIAAERFSVSDEQPANNGI